MELLSSTSKEITFAAISSSSVMYDKSDAGTLVPQESVEHALVDADGEERVFYSELSFDHPDYDVSSIVPDDEYFKKVFNILNGGYKDLPITDKVLEIYGMRQRTEWEGADNYMMLGFYQTRSRENGSHAKNLLKGIQIEKKED